MINFSKNHYYIYLSCRPWPVLCRISCMTTFTSIYLLLKTTSFYPLFISMIFLCLVSYQWWRDLRFEYLYDGFSSVTLESCLKNSILLFISSEVLFFFSFFWSYFHYMFSDCMELGWHWSSLGITMFDYSNVPLLNTLILLRSGITITLSHHYYLNSFHRLSLFYLFLTLFIGMVFTFFQYIEYKSSFFCINDSSFGRVFYLLTGFHGVHVFLGRIFIFIVSLRGTKFNLRQDSILRFDLCSWYWHFVDVVWLLLYFFVYYLSFLRFSIYSTTDFHSVRFDVNVTKFILLFIFIITIFLNLSVVLF